MPPPMPNPSRRMTANPARPVARYRPGKPVAEQESSDEDEEEEEEEDERRQQQRQRQPQRKPQAAPKRQSHAPQLSEASEDEDEDGFVTDPENGEEEQRELGTASIAKAHSGTPQGTLIRQRLKPPDTKEGDEDEPGEEESSSSEEYSSEEEESSSEEEAPRRKFQRPTFIKKSDRKQSQTQASLTSAPEPSTAATSDLAEPTPYLSTELDEQARRLAQADLLIKDKLERDIIARAQGKKAWDDDDDLQPENLVNDTDGLDPEAEYAAWKLRELKRLKRDREALIAREKEIEEIERRRNLTAEERDKEDREYLDKQKQERDEGRSDAQYLARYHHKGAFFQGDETAEFLKRRDVMGARFEDQVSDKSALPEYMRLRDMTKLGKKGRTRYTDLKGQDTGHFGEDVKRWRGSGGGTGGAAGGGAAELDTRGLDERFLPDNQRGGVRTGPTGANASTVGPRGDHERTRDRHREESYGRDGRDDRDRYRESRDRDGNRNDNSPRRDRRRSYSASRSWSPLGSSRRKHSRSGSPVARKRRQVDDFRDDERVRDGARSRYRDGDRSRERDE
ncbi:uncharacterized protein A1O9_10538 [Exophiala aquamarina CBS 119918]|uniref:Micro-fibrillar-associated protein 1 C-terminal domain-containing protein n=1 Tax=Exophiala aquamarina CBS 119918 TaxID=1182545 RepID=A0A072P2R7_9EURO|nr:uncharacterized protein A1O9_10538 [Exophiala aquamarina CBS 119918]KEF53563.1 hypothetical protein A1O9_10538 [Exophiala aquamarina CBS 119918]